jgi:CheY-like chemotaxis protein
MERSRHPEHARLSLRASALRLSGMALSTDSRRWAELTRSARLAPGAAGPSTPSERPKRCLPTPPYSLSRMMPGREALVEILRAEGFWVVTAATVQEAEEIKQQVTSVGIDVVIANIHLTADPESREGCTLWQRWNAFDPQLRFILMSGDMSGRDLPAIRAGAVRWLAKPFGPAEVLETLLDALGR